MAVIRNMSHKLSELRPRVRMERMHELRRVLLSGFAMQSVFLLAKIFINKTLHVVFVSGPQTLLGIPDGIEPPTLDHQILGAPDYEVRIQFKLLVFGFPCQDLIEIHHPPFSPIRLMTWVLYGASLRGR